VVSRVCGQKGRKKNSTMDGDKKMERKKRGKKLILWSGSFSFDFLSVHFCQITEKKLIEFE
jgi:hypothetical protein